MACQTCRNSWLEQTRKTPPATCGLLPCPRAGDGLLRLSFAAIPNRVYTIERLVVLDDDWTTHLEIAAATTNRVVETSYVIEGDDIRLYRLKVRPE